MVELVTAEAMTSVPAAEVFDTLYEFATGSRRTGHAGALELMAAQGAKGLEFKHVLVMDCADWRWSGEDERRLLYVAMTRARETLTVMRAEGGRNPYLVDLGTVEEVVDLLPSARPEDRRDIARRYVTLRPADVDIGFAGRLPSSDQIHSRIAGPFWGTEVIVSGRIVSTSHGGSVVRQAGWLAKQSLVRWSQREPQRASSSGRVYEPRLSSSPA